jgi:hypothetical protein
MAPGLKQAVCAVKQRLISELEAAHAEIMRLGNEEFEIVMDNRCEDEDAISKALVEARRQREHAIRAVRLHVAEHHC